MPNQYGPWATSIGAFGNLQLSAFWRKRLTKLVPTSQTSPTLSRRSLLCLGAAGAMTVLLPMLRSTTAAADDEKPAAQGRKSLAGRVFFQGLVKAKGSDAKQGGIFAVDLETGRCETIIRNAGGFRISPDGKSLAYQKTSIVRGNSSLSETWTCDLTTRATARVLDDGKDLFPSTDDGKAAKYTLNSASICWSPDSRQIVACSQRWSQNHKKPFQCVARRANRDGSAETKLPIPESDEIAGWSSDGKWIVTVSNRDATPGAGGVGYQLYRMRPDGTEQLRLTKEGRNCGPRFSPDGRRIVYRRDYFASKPGADELRVMDADGTNDHVVLRNEELANFADACWSPDGRRLAVLWYTELLENGVKVRKMGEESKHRIEIMDADGTNRREIKFSDAIPHYICGLDWR